MFFISISAQSKCSLLVFFLYTPQRPHVNQCGWYWNVSLGFLVMHFEYSLYCSFFIKLAIILILTPHLLWIKKTIHPTEDVYLCLLHTQYKGRLKSIVGLYHVITRHRCHAAWICTWVTAVSRETGFAPMLSAYAFLDKYFSVDLCQLDDQTAFFSWHFFYTNLTVWLTEEQQT